MSIDFLLAIKFKEVFCFQEGAIGAYGKIWRLLAVCSYLFYNSRIYQGDGDDVLILVGDEEWWNIISCSVVCRSNIPCGTFLYIGENFFKRSCPGWSGVVWDQIRMWTANGQDAVSWSWDAGGVCRISESIWQGKCVWVSGDDIHCPRGYSGGREESWYQWGEQCFCGQAPCASKEELWHSVSGQWLSL